MPKDFNQIAHRVLLESIGEAPKIKALPEKNANAVALGRLGGLKGGKARAEKLTQQQRSQIATKAANTRWNKTR